MNKIQMRIDKKKSQRINILHVQITQQGCSVYCQAEFIKFSRFLFLFFNFASRPFIFGQSPQIRSAFIARSVFESNQREDWERPGGSREKAGRWHRNIVTVKLLVARSFPPFWNASKSEPRVQTGFEVLRKSHKCFHQTT